MPTTNLKVPDTFEPSPSNLSNSKEESVLASTRLNINFTNEDATEKIKRDTQQVPPITPRTDFTLRQANHLVERICRDHGVEAPKLTFAKCLTGQEDEVAALSSVKHVSVLRLAEYLHKRGQIERDYATSIQKLNRHLVQTGDTDERLGQLIVMGEKTAAGHMDWARKIGEERIVDELKTLCGENEEQRRYLLSELKKLRGIWSKAVGGFEKVRKSRDKALKAADSAQLALDTAISRGNTSKNALIRLQEDVRQKSDRARIAQEEYNRAMAALTQRQNEIFKEEIPKCFEGFEKMERSRIAAVRASLISLAQVHLAVADVEIESGQRWLKSLVSLSVDDEIEIFVQSVEEHSTGRKIMEDEIDFEGETEEAEKEEIIVKEPLRHDEAEQQPHSTLYSCSDLTNSESDLLKVSNGIDEISDSNVLKERLERLEEMQSKLRQQFEALQRMEQAYTAQIQQTGETSNEATLAAVKTSMKGISREIEDNAEIISLIEEKLRSANISGSNNNNTDSNGNRSFERINPMSSILEELNKLDQRRISQPKINLLPATKLQNHQQQPVEKKKSLSRSFEDILRSGDGAMLEEEVMASPKATGLKLPGAQWTEASINKSNEEINSAKDSHTHSIKGYGDDYFCAEDEEESIVERNQKLNNVHNAQTQNQSPRRKSIGQSTPNTTANTTATSNNPSSTLVPQNLKELFRVQALYNFIGRKETDELDLRTGEILSIFDASGEWWEAENEAGVRGYIPFNYVIRI